MSGPTTVTEIASWEDDDNNDGEWPYPNQYVKHLVTGELADRSRARLGAPDDADVHLTECVVSGGYSEFTQETYRSFTIEAGAGRVEFDSGGGEVLVELLAWLDGAR